MLPMSLILQILHLNFYPTSDNQKWGRNGRMRTTLSARTQPHPVPTIATRARIARVLGVAMIKLEMHISC